MEREVERLSGTGKVSRQSGELIGSRKYSLVVVEDVVQVRDQWISGLQDASLTIEWKAAEAQGLFGAELWLTVEDGRKLPFVVNSSSGNVRALGGWQ